MEAVLAFVPEEERVKYSAMTGQSLFYMGETNLKHKILAIVEEEGAERASYALKLLQSEGELTIASTGKDPATGKLVTHEYRVEGPVMIFLTTTAIEHRRGAAQPLPRADRRRGPRADARRSTSCSGSRRRSKGCSRGASRDELLDAAPERAAAARPLLVANPFADAADLPRRPHAHAPRPREVPDADPHHRAAAPVPAAGARRSSTDGEAVEYIEVDARGHRASPTGSPHEVLGRSLDELPPQTRRLLELSTRWSARVPRRASARELASRAARCASTPAGATRSSRCIWIAWSSSSTWSCIAAAAPSASYELLYDGEGKDGAPFLPGLLDVEKLRAEHLRSAIPAIRSGLGRPWSGLSRLSVGQVNFRVKGPKMIPARPFRADDSCPVKNTSMKSSLKRHSPPSWRANDWSFPSSDLPKKVSRRLRLRQQQAE